MVNSPRYSGVTRYANAKRRRVRDIPIACTSGVARLADALTIFKTPRPEHSGSVQQILSNMLAHAG